MRHPSTNMAVVWQIRGICYVFNHSTVERERERETLCYATGSTKRQQSNFLTSNPCKNGCGTPTTTDFLSVVIGVPQTILASVSSAVSRRCNLTWYTMSPCNYKKKSSTEWLAYKHVFIPMSLPVCKTPPLLPVCKTPPLNFNVTSSWAEVVASVC